MRRWRKEQSSFSIDDVLDRLSAKLVDRHPHVFGDVKADTAAEVKTQLGSSESRRRKKTAGKRRNAQEEETAVDSCRGLVGHAVVAGGAQAQFARGAGRI